jgi:hypothetical protein
MSGREESRNPGPFARQPRARLTEVGVRFTIEVTLLLIRHGR